MAGLAIQCYRDCSDRLSLHWKPAVRIRIHNNRLAPMTELLHWFRDHSFLLSWLAVISVITFIGTLVSIPALIICIPEDYFLHRSRPSSGGADDHSLQHLVLTGIKNVFGVLFVLAGLAMLVLPGQGLLTILIGLMLMNFPGKYELERKLIRQKPVLAAVNRLRIRAGRPPIEISA